MLTSVDHWRGKAAEWRSGGEDSAMKSGNGQIKVAVHIERRPDGGVRVYSDDVPELVLSGLDVVKVLGDVVPAVELILGERMGCTVTATWLRPFREVRDCPTPKATSAPPSVRPHKRPQRLELAAACAA
jgi:hypothetical protein